MTLVEAPAGAAAPPPADATYRRPGVIAGRARRCQVRQAPYRRMDSMHRSRLVTLLGGTLLAAFLLPSVALASAPRRDRHRHAGRAQHHAALRARDPGRPPRPRPGRLPLDRRHGRRRPCVPPVSVRGRAARPPAPARGPRHAGQAAARRRLEHLRRPPLQLPRRRHRHRRVPRRARATSSRCASAARPRRSG